MQLRAISALIEMATLMDQSLGIRFKSPVVLSLTKRPLCSAVELRRAMGRVKVGF